MSRIRANKITDKLGTGAIELEKGAHLPIGMGITGAGGLNITGVVTATSFSGSGAALTGIDATSLKDPAGNVKIQAQASGAVHTGIHTFATVVAETINPTTVNATTATFTGSVSIGGTLTYEDVINVDSVGIITARSGVDVDDFLTVGNNIQLGNAGIITATGADIDDFLDVGSNIKLGNAGVITATSFIGSGANLTGIEIGISTEALV